MPRHVPFIGLAVAVWLIVLPAVAEAHTPTAGWQRLYSADRQALSWGFGGSYASWLTAPAIAALDTNFADRTTNNSRAPIFGYSSGGSDGTVWLKVASTSPCGTGRVDWLQCANGGGTFGFNIYVRDLYNTSSAYSNWSWYDKTGSCPSGRTCWYLRRTFIHEVQHITIGVGGHDGQGESNTVMAATTPWSPNTGWNQTRIRRCDEAAEQMAYDLDDLSGPYGDCLDHVTNAGVSGLKTDMSVAASSYHQCNNVAVAVLGRLQVLADATNYHKLNGNPLAGRVVRLDRDGVASTYTTKATSVSGNNWSVNVSGTGNATHAFVAHFDDASGDGLADSDRVAFSVTWSAAC
jgi:hypothetical protein